MLSNFDAQFLNLMPDYQVMRHLDLGTYHDNRAQLIPAQFHLYNEIDRHIIHETPTPCFYGNALEMRPYFPYGWFDLITCLDMVEHLFRKEGEQLVRDMEYLCRGRIIYFTPFGQYLYNADRPYQEHKHGWYPEDFIKMGYSCWVLPNMHEGHGAFYAVKDKLGTIRKTEFQDSEWFKGSYWICCT